MWQKCFSKDNCSDASEQQQQNLDHAYLMFSLELAATTQERHLQAITEKSLCLCLDVQ